MGADHSCCVIRDASIFTTENSTRHCLLLSHQHVGHIHSKMSTAGFSSFFGSFSQRQRYFDTDTLTCNQMFKMTIYHFLSLYPMIFEYWARICRRYRSVGPILADTDILNPRTLMAALFSLAFLNPSFILKQGCHTYGLGGSESACQMFQSGPSGQLWKMWWNVMKGICLD